VRALLESDNAQAIDELMQLLAESEREPIEAAIERVAPGQPVRLLDVLWSAIDELWG
jgi:hypothetical protein